MGLDLLKNIYYFYLMNEKTENKVNIWFILINSMISGKSKDLSG